MGGGIAHSYTNYKKILLGALACECQALPKTKILSTSTCFNAFMCKDGFIEPSYVNFGILHPPQYPSTTFIQL